MTDPSSQKPSDQDTDGGQQDRPPPKLKLKGIVPTESETGDSIDEGAQTSRDENQARPKLKHLMSPLSPHLKKVRETDKTPDSYKPKMDVPSAVPYDEPGVDQVPPGVKPPIDKPPPVVAPPVIPPVETVPTVAPPQMQPKPQPEPKEAAPEPEAPGDPQTKLSEALVSAPKKKPKLLKYALILVNVLIILTAVQYFLDPLGLKIEPFEHTAPVVTKQLEEEIASDLIANAIAPIESFDDLESVSVETFLKQLEEATIQVSKAPEGVIINSIFYPIGSTLHPALGIVVDAVEINPKDNLSNVWIVDSEGNRYGYGGN